MTAPNLGRVLIVDDEVELMTALCESLTDQSYEALGRTSAQEALALLQEEDIDLLVCDLMMPEMDGIALLRAALNIDPHLVGVIMTGHGTIQTAVDAMKVGAFDYVLKPFRLQALLPVLARALQVRRLRMENVQLRETVAIYELGQAIACPLDTNTILHKVIDGALQQVNGDEAAIMLPTSDSEELFVAVVRGQNQETLLGTRVSMAHSVMGWVARHREPLTVPGAVSDLPFTPQHTCADFTTLALPMLTGGKLMGVLSVSAARRRPFTLGQVKALSILTNLAATALENATLYTQVCQSEERFRSVTESAIDAIISTDTNGIMLSWNHGAQRLFGYARDEMVGQPLTMLMPARYRGSCLDGLDRVVATGQQCLVGKTLEVHGLTRDGEEFPVELSLSSWQTGASTFFGVIIRDITERKQAEEALRQSEAHYRALVEGSLQGIVIARQDGTRVFANTALARMLGYEAPQELVGGSLWDHVAPEDVPRLRTSFEARLWARRSPERYEHQAVKKDGTRLWVESLVSPMTWDGTPAALETSIDITERKRLETQLRQAQKMQAIGTLAGGIAHDFNNILSAILGYTELALDEVEQGSAVWNKLQGTLAAGRRARDLVQQILAFSRQTELTRVSIQMHLLVEEALTLLRAALPSTLMIRPIIDRHAGAVLVDPTQMQQVLINLCTNAAHAMREAGGTIEVRLEPIEIAVDALAIPPDLKAGAYVRLTVQDTGHGMEPEILERIFEPFFTTKSMGEGTGMGLAVVHGIIANHGGAITVESTPGQGSTFAVYLPRSDSPSTAALPAEEPIVGGNERILFVDDEATLVHLGKVTLQRLGYQVIVCTSSSEALETFRAAPHSFHLVITDRTMPTLTGEELVHKLRQIRPDIPIILCTGFSHPVTSEQLRALRVDAFLLKPVMADEWARMIRQVLERRATEKM
jgi:PAS domain S-box-containing protein